MSQSRRQFISDSLRTGALGLVPASLLRADDFAFTSDPFTLGVASGYPEQAAVVLWARLAPEPLAPGGGMQQSVVTVDWELAEDEAFRRVRRSGRAYATPDWGHSVHVEVTGLQPGRDYWYRFTSGGARSPVGHTRTAAAAGSPRMALAVASCQHYESGYYAAYAAIARDDLDLILHVGDYIYENRGIERVRSHAEPECYTLEDYRRRYSIYKLDPMLQAAHASAPWMLIWDDHEVDNDYAAGRSEQDDVEALFLARRAAAYRAYYENQPLPRRMVPQGPYQRLYTRRVFGDLVAIHMLDGRQYRSDQACGAGRVNPCAELLAEDRTMLGAEQERWLDTSLGQSSARWTLLAQGTVFAHMDQEPGPGVGYWNDGWSGYPAARRRLIEALEKHSVPNPVILSGDVHAFLANDVHAEPGRLESRVAAAEFVTTSISSLGPPQSRVDSWRAENSNVRLARSDVRGYTKLSVEADALHVEFVAVEDPTRPDSDTYLLASFDVAEGRPGIVDRR